LINPQLQINSIVFVIKKSTNRCKLPFSVQNPPKKTQNHQNRGKIGSRRLAGVHHRQTIHQNPKNCVDQLASHGGKTCTARQFLIGNPENTQKLHESPDGFEGPPSDFWKISRNMKSYNFITVQALNKSIIIQEIITLIKPQSPAPLTWFPCLSLGIFQALVHHKKSSPCLLPSLLPIFCTYPPTHSQIPISSAID